MFLHKLTASLSREFGISYYSINHRRYQREIKSNGWNTLIASKQGVNVFGPIRAGEARPYFPDNISSYNIILHLRDPRDVLTSLFYSHVYSHTRKKGVFSPSDKTRIQWQEDGIDAYIEMKMPDFKDRYSELCDTLIGLDSVTIVKYEDMVERYHIWLSDYLSVFSDIDINRRLFNIFPVSNTVDDIYDRLYNKFYNEFDVSSENKYKHKRQITPGDHKRKLKPETIDMINHEFGDILDVLGYPSDVQNSLSK